MKRCPECDSFFPDVDQFCELDGTPLVTDDSDSGAVVRDRTEQKVNKGTPSAVGEAARESDGSWKTMAIVAVAGVAIGVALFLIYYAMTREAPRESSNESPSNSSIMQQQGPLLPSLPSPVASASPSAESSPSPSARPSPSAQADSARVESSSSPVSTGGDEKTGRGPITIRLTNGTSVEADEVWKTGEGIWYRRRGVLTLLDPKQVKAIEQAAAPTPQPSTSQSPSPQ